MVICRDLYLCSPHRHTLLMLHRKHAQFDIRLLYFSSLSALYNDIPRLVNEKPA